VATSKLNGTPVLMYHGIAASGAAGIDKYGVTQDKFLRQLGLLRQQELKVCTLSELRAAKLDSKSVVITFDDGLNSDYAIALPALTECNLTAHFFVNTANVGKPGYMNWTQVREMDRTGMQIGSHGHQHVDHSRPSEQTLVKELRMSREMLQDELGHAVEWFAPPYGFVNRKTIRAAEAAGFSGVATSRISLAEAGSAVVPRIAVEASTTDHEFQAIILGRASIYLKRNLRAMGLYFPKQLLLRYKPSMLGVNVLQEHA
jgi:peptidoglycan/xylan/chitin deacetylase (PgdA/CDA1 family)